MAAKHLRQTLLSLLPIPRSRSFPWADSRCLVIPTKRSSTAGKRTAPRSSPPATAEQSQSPQTAKTSPLRHLCHKKAQKAHMSKLNSFVLYVPFVAKLGSHLACKGLLANYLPYKFLTHRAAA